MINLPQISSVALSEVNPFRQPGKNKGKTFSTNIDSVLSGPKHPLATSDSCETSCGKSSTCPQLEERDSRKVASPSPPRGCGGRIACPFAAKHSLSPQKPVGKLSLGSPPSPPVQSFASIKSPSPTKTSQQSSLSQLAREPRFNFLKGFLKDM